VPELGILRRREGGEDDGSPIPPVSQSRARGRMADGDVNKRVVRGGHIGRLPARAARSQGEHLLADGSVIDGGKAGATRPIVRAARRGGCGETHGHAVMRVDVEPSVQAEGQRTTIGEDGVAHAMAAP